MMQLVIFLALAVGLLVLLLMAMRRQPSHAAGSAGELVTAKKTLESLQLGLLPAELVDQIFGERDLTYVGTIGSNEIRSLFLSERKRLALTWIRRVREQVRALKDFHVSRSRMFTQMSRWRELSLAFDFAGLEGRCRVLQLLLLWRGPYAAPGFARRTAATAGRVCSTLDQSLAFLTPSIPVSLASESDADGSMV
ncbi:MAG TPA: hypothetical protein VOA88_06750 [Candidatus Dormibacteraeota bacterium]|jgi:hypothetical protein|nr:hypothetical protein [Candidatus Dormibacteraeota bacterium]